MTADDLIELLIVGAYAGLFIAAAWFAGQLLIVFIEYIAECIERRRF